MGGAARHGAGVLRAGVVQKLRLLWRVLCGGYAPALAAPDWPPAGGNSALSLIGWMVRPYRRYAEFDGRSRRREFWAFVVFYWLVTAAIIGAFGRPMTVRWPFGYSFSLWLPQGSVGGWVSGLFWALSIVPFLALGVRRLHDVDRSGWWLLAWFMPMFGWAVLLVFACLDGSVGRNRYGTDPKGRMTVDMYR